MKPRIAILALAVMLAGCALATIVQLVNAGVQIAEQAAAITGAIPPQYVAYVQAGSNCLAFVAIEQATADSPVVKYDKDAAQCAMLVSPVLPPGTPQNVVDMAGKLAAAIQNILANLKPAPVSTTARAAQEKPLSASDLKALSVLADRAKAAGVAVQHK